MTDYIRAASVLLLLSFLAGCGQSGPLFVPGDPSVVQPQPGQQPQQQPPAQEEEEDDDNGAASP